MELEEMMNIILAKPDTIDIVLSLFVTLLFSMIMAITYRLTYDEREYQFKFSITLVTLAIISTVLMDLIQTNLALSLGMLGSLSIVRFRTTIKDPRDIGFIFWSMAIGIASATHSYTIGLFGSILLATLMILSKLNHSNVHNMLLVIKGSSADIDTITQIIYTNTLTANVKAKNVMSDSFEIVYEVEICDENENKIIGDLFKFNGIDSINLLAQNA